MDNSPNSVLIRLQTFQLRCLLDTGAEKTLMHERVYNMLKYKPPLSKKKIVLQSANGSEVHVLGSVVLSFKIGGLKLEQEFLVVSNLNRNIILGNDFLVKNSARLYFDLKQIRLKGSYYIPFENDVFISSIARLSKTILLKPNTAYLVKAQIKALNPLKKDALYELEKLEKGFISEQPEIQLCESVSNLTNTRFFPVQLVNNSTKHIRLKRGCVLGTLQEAKIIDSIWNEGKKDISIQEFNSMIHTHKDNFNPVSQLLQKYRKCFAFSDAELEGTDLLEAHIDTRDNDPVSLRPYRTPLAQQQVVSESLDKLLEAGIIRQSISPWCFPMVVVEKKPDGTGIKPPPRLAIDYRALNRLVYIRAFPMPRIDDILGKLHGCSYFTSLDMRAGFHQIKLTPESAEKTAFSCFKGKYEYSRLPYGLNNAASIFQQMAAKLLSGCEQFAIAYIDDILIFTKSDLYDHLQHVEVILNKLKQHKLRLKLSKCFFAKSEIDYLGFVISKNGLKPNDQKVQAIKSLRPPTTVKQVRSFIGMTTWYRQFIPNFAGCAEPLINLTKKYAKFIWDDKCERAFTFLKDSLSTIPLLAYPDVNKPYTLYTDASDTCVGAVLVQDEEITNEDGIIQIIEKPIYFISHKLSDTQIKSYSTVEKEAFAIHYALNKLHFYLCNAKFTIKTDHQPLRTLFTSEQKNRRVQSWGLTISSYNTKIEYLTGESNIVADLLSRSPPAQEQKEAEINNELLETTFNVNAINSNKIDPKQFTELKMDNLDNEQQEIPKLDTFNTQKEQEKDDEIMKIKTKLSQGLCDKQISRKYLLHDDILYYISQVDDNPNLRLVVPQHLKQTVLQQYHDDNGHMGVQKVYQTIKEKYYWINLYKDIYSLVEHCVTCKKRNLTQQKATSLETGMAPFPFACLSLDLSGPFRQTISGNNYIISFVDLYSGWVEAYPLQEKSAEAVIQILLNEIIPRFSCPLSITTDNGSEFANSVFRQTMEHLNIHHKFSSPYHPETNAKVERSHKTLNDLLAKKIEDNVDTWDVHITSALWAHRTNVSVTTKKSPFFLLYNRLPLLPLDNLLLPRKHYQGEEYHLQVIENMHRNFLQTVKLTRKAKLASIKRERNRTDTEFKVGDNVYYRNHTKKSKLENNWHTHYIIIEQNGPVSYTIRNQLTGGIKRAHANSLRQASVLWEVPKQTGSKLFRNAQLVETPPSDSDSGEEDIETKNNSGETGAIIDNESLHSEDSDDTVIYDPKGFQASTNKKFSEELNEGPSLAQLQKQIRIKRREEEYSSDDEFSSDSNSNESMDINNISCKKRTKLVTDNRSKPNTNSKIKSLLAAVANILD